MSTTMQRWNNLDSESSESNKLEGNKWQAR